MNPRIIAEVAKAHNGDLNRAITLIEEAAVGNPHAIKMQYIFFQLLSILISVFFSAEHPNYIRINRDTVRLVFGATER